MLTTEIDGAKKKEAKEKGATGWLNKPFDHDKMLTTVQRVLE
jgi:two-component system chemotaxis response regulator CheY